MNVLKLEVVQTKTINEVDKAFICAGYLFMFRYVFDFLFEPIARYIIKDFICLRCYIENIMKKTVQICLVAF